MPDITTKLGLKKPLGNETVSRAAYNENWDIIDAGVVADKGGAPSIQAGQDASKPAPGTVGRLYVATDTQIIYRDTGTAWAKVGVVKWGEIDGKPVSFTPSTHGNEAHDPDLALASDLAAHSAENASETVKGHVELATAAETTAGTDNTRAVHPAGLKVELDKKLNITSYTANDVLAKILTVDGAGSGLVSDMVDDKHYNQLAYEVLRDLSGVIQYEAGNVATNNTEVSLAAYGGSWYNLGKTITVNCDTLNFMKVDYELQFTGISGSATIKGRLKNNASGLYYAESPGKSTPNNTYVWDTGYADVSDLSGNVIFSVEVYVQWSSPAMTLWSRGLDIHQNQKRRVRWS